MTNKSLACAGGERVNPRHTAGGLETWVGCIDYWTNLECTVAQHLLFDVVPRALIVFSYKIHRGLRVGRDGHLDQHEAYGNTQQALDVGPTLVYCWANVVDVGPTVNQRWVTQRLVFAR